MQGGPLRGGGMATREAIGIFVQLSTTTTTCSTNKLQRLKHPRSASLPIVEMAI